MRKLARFNLVRNINNYFSKHKFKNSKEPVSDQSDSLFKELDIDEVVKQLKENGFYLGINLPQDIVTEIIEFAYSHPCHGNRKPWLGFYYYQKEQINIKLEKRFALASYFNTYLHCPAIQKLRNDPILLAISTKYLNTQPVIQGNELWWSFAGEISNSEKKRAFQMFHYDIDDYKFLKFFFYLTDVDETSGAHVCIRGSHKKKKFTHLLFHKKETDQDIIDYYGREKLVIICGKAGFGFVEDTSCFHKGTTPTAQDRLILQIEFATADYNMQNDLKSPSSCKLLISE
ncbi:phytanoyl-CoA dioxygenase family protein [Chlorogloeopsis sp. ULAP02]|uniref:phytanoyl-CoA dioxygenase family protein n=1 Tax=Chlorogloeopsis sp. ULAP02 TaxID=3107926 RepID=UPI00313757B5